MSKFISAFVLAFLSFSVLSEITPLGTSLDDRIKVVTYVDSQVYEINTNYLIETHIEFERDETIFYIGAGDRQAWTITPKLNNVFIKPVLKKADSNIKIITNKRTYNFIARAYEKPNLKSGAITLHLKFIYPDSQMAQALKKIEATEKKVEAEAKVIIESKPNHSFDIESLNMDYEMSGDLDFAPIRAFDNGAFTYFQFREKASLPAIFIVSDSGTPLLANYFPEGHYIAVHKVAGQFILVFEDKKICIWNTRYKKDQEKTHVKIVSGD